MKKSSTVALLLSTTRDAVSEKFGSGVFSTSKNIQHQHGYVSFPCVSFLQQNTKTPLYGGINHAGLFFLWEVEDIRESKRTTKDQVNK